MKFKVIASIAGVLLAVGVIGVGTIMAQGGGPTATPPTANPGTAACQQYMQSLAQHLGVSVDKLTQATKDAAKDMVDQAVKGGRLTQDQANQAKQRIDQAQGECGFGRFGFGFFKGFGHFGVPPAGAPPFGGPRGPRGPRNGGVVTETRTINGAILTEVVADSPAAKAGLQAGDVILAVGGQAIDNQHLLDALLRQKKPGDAFELKIQHGSDTKTVNVTLGAQPNNAAVPYLGIRFQYRRGAT
jgi:membrane-associated protease RseP (regulator of RpoE activity)